MLAVTHDESEYWQFMHLGGIGPCSELLLQHSAHRMRMATKR